MYCLFLTVKSHLRADSSSKKHLGAQVLDSRIVNLLIDIFDFSLWEILMVFVLKIKDVALTGIPEHPSIWRFR